MIKNCPKGISISPQQTNFGPIMFAGRLFDGLRSLAENGFDCVELSLRSVNDVSPIELKKRLNDLNLKISAIATGQACLFDQLCLGCNERSQREIAINHFKKITDLSLEIGSGAVIIGGIRGRLQGVGQDYQKNYEYGLDAIRDCAMWSDQNQMPLLIEPINRYETNWVFTAEEGRKILDEIGIPSVKLLLDTFHMNIEERSTVQAILDTGENLGYVHFADNTRYPPGQGQTNFISIIKALNQIQYTGPIVTEALPLPDDKLAVENTAKFWKDMELNGD
jgi:sugar phosphate isomerase/epimerase